MKQYISKAFWIFVFLLWQRQPVYGQPPPPPGDHGSEQNENPFQQAPPRQWALCLINPGNRLCLHQVIPPRSEGT
jgi:hypothetical protein